LWVDQLVLQAMMIALRVVTKLRKHEGPS
jgi:hypothetical protein